MTTGDDSEPSVEAIPSHRAPRDARQRFADGRAAFRAWRRSRPFWGGLLLVISGLELVALPLSGVLVHGALKLVIYIGIGGVFGVLIGILLVAAGIMCWISPAQRVFYGIAGIVLGVLSFPASNLGGFFLGMLLAIVGGSLAFAWTRAEPQPVPVRADAESEVETTGLDIVTDDANDEAPTEEIPTDEAPEEEPDDPVSKRQRSTGGSRGQHALAVATMPALLVAGFLASPAHPAHSSQLCILGICIGPAPTPSASANPSASASGTETPNPTTGSSSSASPQPGSSGNSTSKATASPSPTSTKVKQASAGSGLEASSATSVLTAGSATLTHFIFQGIVNMPVSGGGTEKMLKFTASSADLTDGVELSVTQNGLTTETQSPTLDFTGDMTLYATKLTGTLAGIPLTFTPTTIDAIVLKFVNFLTGLVPITMTNVTTYQPVTTAGALQTGSLSLGF